MKKNLLVLTLCAGALLMTGCASKKDLQNCQSENQRLSSECPDKELGRPIGTSKGKCSSLAE